MLRTLPSYSLVPFEIQRLSQPEVLWSNSELIDNTELHEYAYCVPAEHEQQGAYLSETRVTFGERYGGRGIMHNGGGVRCGFDGKWQVKGIGRNCLAGDNPNNFWNTHGGATLEEGVREAVWGEICHLVLPWGGIRIAGIVDTGTKTHYQSPQGESMVPRALILREPALRPAHYMRAPDYHPNSQMRTKYCSDTVRTKAAVLEIDQGFASALGMPLKVRHDPQFINQCLAEMVTRISLQIATARAKRIMHGSISCSNIALDGRFLDYGTISSLSDYGRVIIARGSTDLWTEHTALYPTLSNLIFYMKKYLPETVGKELLSYEKLVAFYNYRFSRDLVLQFLKLTGIPLFLLQQLNNGLLNDMGRCLSDIFTQGNKEPFKFRTLDEMPNMMGNFHLNSIIQVACLCSSESEAEQAIFELLHDPALRKRFAHIYVKIRQAALALVPQEQKKIARLFIAINAYRLNTLVSELYRPKLADTISDLLATPDAARRVAFFVDGMRRQVRTLLAEPGEKGIAMDWYCNQEKWLSLSAIVGSNQQLFDPRELIDSLEEVHFSMEQKRQLMALCD